MKGAFIMEENKEIVQLLKQIEKNNRKQARIAGIQCVFAVVTALCCVLLFVMIFNILPQLNGVMTQMQTVLSNLEETSEQLAAVDLESMVADVDTLVATGQRGLEETMEKLNSLNFDALNQAIEDLGEVIEPIASFFKKF